MQRDADQPQTSPTRKHIWVRWTVLTSFAFVAGNPLATGMAFSLIPISPASGDAGVSIVMKLALLDFVKMAVLGFFIGFFQWTILRKRIPKASLWIIATVIGLAVGSTLARPVSFIAFTLAAFVLAFFVALITSPFSLQSLGTALRGTGSGLGASAQELALAITLIYEATEGLMGGLLAGFLQRRCLPRGLGVAIGMTWIVVSASLWAGAISMAFFLSWMAVESDWSTSMIGAWRLFVVLPLSGLALGVAQGWIMSRSLVNSFGQSPVALSERA